MLFQNHWRRHPCAHNTPTVKQTHAEQNSAERNFQIHLPSTQICNLQMGTNLNTFWNTVGAHRQQTCYLDPVVTTRCDNSSNSASNRPRYVSVESAGDKNQSQRATHEGTCWAICGKRCQHATMQQLECDCTHNAHKGTHNGFGANSITPGKAAWSRTDHKCTRWNSGVFSPAPSTLCESVVSTAGKPQDQKRPPDPRCLLPSIGIRAPPVFALPTTRLGPAHATLLGRLVPLSHIAKGKPTSSGPQTRAQTHCDTMCVEDADAAA